MLQDHQIYLLQVLALPLIVQKTDYHWDAEPLPRGIYFDWHNSFTDFGIGGEGVLLDFSDDNIRGINSIFQNEPESSEFWSNEGHEKNSKWRTIQLLAERILHEHRIALKKPDPNAWYDVLPENLQW